MKNSIIPYRCWQYMVGGTQNPQNYLLEARPLVIQAPPAR